MGKLASNHIYLQIVQESQRRPLAPMAEKNKIDLEKQAQACAVKTQGNT